MKTFIQNSISVLFGLYFLIAGTGFNVLNYCCNLCEDEGIEVVIVEAKRIQHDRTDTMSCCNPDMHNDNTNQYLQYSSPCQLTRYSVDISPLSSFFKLKIDSISTLILFTNVQLRIFETKFTNTDSRFRIPPPDQLKLQSGREILAANSVLLI